MKLLTTIITLLITVGMAHSQTSDFEDWDADGDLLIERHEFTTKFIDEFYKAWDPSNTEGILEEGFFESSYAGLDTDGDNFLSDEEWLIGYNYFYDDYLIYEDIDVADVNEDGKVSYEEYYDVMYETEYFTDIDIDSDNYISEYELANYVFENWDTNDSGMISKSEFMRFDNYYLDV